MLSRKRPLRRSRKSQRRQKSSTKLSLYGLATHPTSLRKNMAASTSPCLMIGRTILPSNISLLRVNWNSVPSFSFPRELLSTFSNPRKRRTISNFTSDVSSSLMIVKNSSLSGLDSSRVSSIRKIYLSISPEKCCNRTRFSKSSGNILSRRVWNSSRKLPRTKINSRVFTPTFFTDFSLLRSLWKESQARYP
jgi:hypothetical protein